MTAIKHGPCTCDNSTGILNTRRVAQTMLHTASTGPLLWHQPHFLTLVGMRPLSGPNCMVATSILLLNIRY
jgi:hypothetical protein